MSEMTTPSPEQRKTLIAKKREEIRRLQYEEGQLVDSCEHQIASRGERNINTLITNYRVWQTWQETEFKPIYAKMSHEPNSWKKNRPVMDELNEVYKREPERVWSFGGAYCSICEQDFGWYCPDSPKKYCIYEKTNMDDCDYCHLPEERK